MDELDKKLKKIVDGFGEWSDVEDVDRRLKYLAYVKYKCEQSINNSYLITFSKIERFFKETK